MKKKIEQPKVFISYAWATKDYEAKVLAFASKLVDDGVDVVIDKWDMSEGNDTYSFMERCANDPSITNVLMLIDPTYAKKADAHTGGVGTETQIISAKVYQEVDQNKFIPVVFERDEHGNVCKPTYLQGRLHFDLTSEDEYDETYQRLVKTLFGEEVYKKPTLGKKPAWVEKPIDYSPKSMVRYDEIKKNVNNKVRKKLFISYLKEISDRIVHYSNESPQIETNEEYIQSYDLTKEIRNDFLLLLQHAQYVDDYHEYLSSFFEDTAVSLYDLRSWRGAFGKIFLHEIFIYAIAFLWNNKEYREMGYIFGKTYFTKRYTRGDTGATSFNLMYSGSEHDFFDKIVKSVDGKNYYSGTAAHWVTNIAVDFCSKEQFVFADLLCFNYSIYGKQYSDDWRWFPVTYCYDSEYDSEVARFAKKLISKSYLNTVLPIFCFDSADEFVDNMRKLASGKQRLREYRYNGAFEPANAIEYFIQPDAIGTLP